MTVLVFTSLEWGGKNLDFVKIIFRRSRSRHSSSIPKNLFSLLILAINSYTVSRHTVIRAGLAPHFRLLHHFFPSEMRHSFVHAPWRVSAKRDAKLWKVANSRFRFVLPSFPFFPSNVVWIFTARRFMFVLFLLSTPRLYFYILATAPCIDRIPAGANCKMIFL